MFTSRELAIGAELTIRNIALLIQEGIAPNSLTQSTGKSGHRKYDCAALAHAALIGALHRAGFELLVSARLAAAFADDFASYKGHLPSNLEVFLHKPLNTNSPNLPWGKMPEDLDVDWEKDYWLHHLLRNRSVVYQRGIAQNGDWIIDIADHKFVLTYVLGSEKIKIHSPVSREGLPASPDYRIEGRGSRAQIIPIHEEVEDLDFYNNPKSAEKMRQLEQDYINGRRDATTRVVINLSLAIRNAFDRVHDDREKKIAA